MACEDRAPADLPVGEARAAFARFVVDPSLHDADERDGRTWFVPRPRR